MTTDCYEEGLKIGDVVSVVFRVSNISQNEVRLVAVDPVRETKNPPVFTCLSKFTEKKKGAKAQ